MTGGSGFIGSNFLNLLVPAHPETDFLNLDKLSYAANPKSLTDLEHLSNYRFQRCDLGDFEGLSRVVADFRPDHVFHFAAESHVDRSIHNPGAFVASNVVGTLNLLEACRPLCGPNFLFHHVSTDEVYGSLGPEGAFTEESRYDPSSP